MKIEKIVINNFRKLKDNVSLYFNNEMLLVGKNNSGKTSVYEILEKFIAEGDFIPQDFNDEVYKKDKINNLYEQIKTTSNEEEFESVLLQFPKITLDIYIKLENNDNLIKIKPLLFEFDNNESIIIKCVLSIKDIKKAIKDFEQYNNEIDKASAKEKIDNLKFFDFINRNFTRYFKCSYYSSKPNCDYILPLEYTEVKNLFTISIINARRDVDDTADQTKQNISLALWEYYKYKKDNVVQDEDIFRESVSAITTKLDTNYETIFEDIINKLCEDIFTNQDTKMKIVSEINIEEILKRNSKLKYVMNDLDLSESSNGLGYSNLIYILIKVMAFRELSIKNDRLFNILFIEEPESHLHPQLQSTFFEKINSILTNDIITYTIFSTHSSYMLMHANIHSINYFCNNKNLSIKSLSEFLENEDSKEFIIKYFKLNTCDLFFADKAILIEGSVERILFPTIINKFDKTHSTNLSKQNVSILEVGGTYAYLFYDLLKFLEIQTLIVTDNDARKETKCICDIDNEIKTKTKTIYTSNPILKRWFNSQADKLYLVDLIKKDAKEFIKCDGCNFKLVTQLPNNILHISGRTFEEQLIYENANNLSQVLFKKKETDLGIKFLHLRDISKNIKAVDEIYSTKFFENNFFEIVQNLRKTDFAIDLITHPDSWSIPKYIEEGLLWLK